MLTARDAESATLDGYGRASARFAYSGPHRTFLLAGGGNYII
jgi:hypothetical protein